MKQRPRRCFSEPEILAMWERWHAGESLNSMARDLDRGHSAVHGALARTAGLHPVQRKSSALWRSASRSGVSGSGGSTRNVPEGRNTRSATRAWMYGLKVTRSPKVCT